MAELEHNITDVDESHIVKQFVCLAFSPFCKDYSEGCGVCAYPLLNNLASSAKPVHTVLLLVVFKLGILLLQLQMQNQVWIHIYINLCRHEPVTREQWYPCFFRVKNKDYSSRPVERKALDIQSGYSFFLTGTEWESSSLSFPMRNLIREQMVNIVERQRFLGTVVVHVVHHHCYMMYVYAHPL